MTQTNLSPSRATSWPALLKRRLSGLLLWLFAANVLILSGAAQAQDEELLAAEDAFAFSLEVVENDIQASWAIADGYYMYRNRLSFSLKNEAGNEIPLEYDYPTGKMKSDPSFGDVEVYTKHADFVIPVEAQSGGYTLIAKGQGCNEPVGVCYPPIKYELPISFISSAGAATIDSTPGGIVSNSDAAVAAAGVASVAGGSKLWWVLLTAFAAGIGLTFTPCVLPLIPILSSVIAGQGEQLTKRKAAFLSAVYVMGTAVTYAAIGAVAGATGDQLQAYFQNAWAIGTMALVFFIMSLSMFGLFDIQMPSFIQSRLSSSSQNIKGGSVPMVFVLGLMSALIVGACVSPILISFLSLAIAEGSPTLGAMTMFSMAIGMGVPLVLLGVGAGHLLPKAGMWMDKVKYVFGVMLIAVGIYMLSVLPEMPVLYLWAALFIVVAIYLGATQPLPEGGSGWQKLSKGAGTVLLLWGTFSLVGAIYGERDVMHPLPERLFASAPAAGAMEAESETPVFTRIANVEQLDLQLAAAQKAGKGVIIDYYADWCVSCIKMEKKTFADSGVRKVLDEQFIALQVDVTDPGNLEAKALKTRYGVFGPPAILFFDENGTRHEDKSFYGYKDPAEFLSNLGS